MRGDAPPTCGAESSEWVFAAVNCSILPDVRHVHMSENMCICPSLDQHGHMHRTYTRGRVGRCYSARSAVPCHHAASDLMQEKTTVSSIGSAYTLVQDFIGVTWNTDDVWHLRVQYKCEQCERTNDFATRRKRYLSPLPGAGWILLFAENPRFFFVLFFSPVLEIFPRRPDASCQVFRKSWGG